MQSVQINYLAVIIAAVLNLVLGMLWYGPVFGRYWKKLMGFTDESMKSMKMTPAKAMIGGLLSAFLMSYVLAHCIVFAGAYFAVSGVSAGLMSGFWNWLGFVVPVSAGVVLWEGKPWKLWFLNVSFWLVALLLMGALLAVWR